MRGDKKKSSPTNARRGLMGSGADNAKSYFESDDAGLDSVDVAGAGLELAVLSELDDDLASDESAFLCEPSLDPPPLPLFA